MQEIVDLGVLEQFLNHINFHHLCKTTDKLLLAVSGGIDSMVMLRLFVDGGFKPDVVHCNFMLRGDASMGDEQLVKDECIRMQLPFHFTRFDTTRIASERKMSIQVVARDLRYEYFEQLRMEIGAEKVATAHNANDNLETVLLNLVRGTGIQGLGGIAVSTGTVIRPLLYASRKSIHEFALDHQVTWREDASNLEDDYTRNYLRLHVVPHLHTLNPNLETTFNTSIERISAGINLAKAGMEQQFSRCVRADGKKILIDREKLAASGAPAVLLWEYLKTFGFNYQTCRLIVQPHQSGKKFIAGDKMLTVDRQNFVLEDFDNSDFNAQPIRRDDVTAEMGELRLDIRYRENIGFVIETDSGVAQLDAERLVYPMVWRRWQAGDTFVPLGMTASKKVSDFLTDVKVSTTARERVTVLQSGGDIVWVVGYRINEHYKIAGDTRQVMIVTAHGT